MGRVDSCCLVILGLSLGLLEAQNLGPAVTPAPVSVRDPALYPVCVSDSDCDKISDKGGLSYTERVHQTQQSLSITNDSLWALNNVINEQHLVEQPITISNIHWSHYHPPFYPHIQLVRLL